MKMFLELGLEEVMEEAWFRQVSPETQWTRMNSCPVSNRSAIPIFLFNQGKMD